MICKLCIHTWSLFDICNLISCARPGLVLIITPGWHTSFYIRNEIVLSTSFWNGIMFSILKLCCKAVISIVLYLYYSHCILFWNVALVPLYGFLIFIINFINASNTSNSKIVRFPHNKRLFVCQSLSVDFKNDTEQYHVQITLRYPRADTHKYLYTIFSWNAPELKHLNHLLAYINRGKCVEISRN